jgi:hypothetical protein
MLVQSLRRKANTDHNVVRLAEMWQSACKQFIDDEEGCGKTERSRSDHERGDPFGQRLL